MTPSGYSGAPLAKKLGYKPGFAAWLINAPTNYHDLVKPLPEGVSFAESADEANLVHLFARDVTELADCLPGIRDKLHRDGMIWVSWPKRASKVPTNITEETIREVALPLGLVDIKVCAVDVVWSGLKLVIRKELR